MLVLDNHLWTHRNSVLHETQALDALSGVTTLRNLIIAEYALGQSSLHRFLLQVLLSTTGDSSSKTN